MFPALSEDVVMCFENDLIFMPAQTDPEVLTKTLYSGAREYFREYNRQKKKTHEGFSGEALRTELLGKYIMPLIEAYESGVNMRVSNKIVKLSRFITAKQPFRDIACKIVSLASEVQTNEVYDIICKYVDLINAVKSENYEQAAILKDQIEDLKSAVL